MTPNDFTQPLGGLGFSSRTAAGCTVATLSGELDLLCARVLREQLLSVLGPRASRLVVDLSEVSFCDASGLAVLVGIGRRARLLGGALRLAAPTHEFIAALRSSCLLGQFEIFPTVLAATTAQPQPAEYRAQAGTRRQIRSRIANGGPLTQNLTPPAANAPDPSDLGEAVTAILAHADAWRDADPDRRFTSTLQDLARARAGNDHAALTRATRFLLATLARYPLTYSSAVATTASDLRHLIDANSAVPALTTGQ